MTLRARTDSDPPPVEFDAFQACVETLMECGRAVVGDADHWQYRWDEAYKLHRTLLRPEDLLRAQSLALELRQLVERMDQALRQVVHEPPRD
jgi:hypothetical protein